jgi:ABC-type transport system involved in cytochrome bd biosynthesis fused ATPase/permease subunit
MDVGLLAAILLLVLWAVGTFFFDAPGWITLALSVGVFLLIWRIVARSAGRPATTRNGK